MPHAIRSPSASILNLRQRLAQGFEALATTLQRTCTALTRQIDGLALATIAIAQRPGTTAALFSAVSSLEACATPALSLRATYALRVGRADVSQPLTEIREGYSRREQPMSAEQQPRRGAAARIVNDAVSRSGRPTSFGSARSLAIRWLSTHAIPRVA